MVLCVRFVPSEPIVIVSFAASPVSTAEVLPVATDVTAALAALGAASAAAAATAASAAVRRGLLIRAFILPPGTGGFTRTRRPARRSIPPRPVLHRSHRSRERPGAVHQARKRAPELLAKPFAHGDQRIEVDAGLDA